MTAESQLFESVVEAVRYGAGTTSVMEVPVIVIGVSSGLVLASGAAAGRRFCGMVPKDESVHAGDGDVAIVAERERNGGVPSALIGTLDNSGGLAQGEVRNVQDDGSGRWDVRGS